MKYRKLVAPNYEFRDELGNFLFHNVTVLISSDSDITRESFDQSKDDFMISSDEIERMGRESAQRFFNDKYIQIIQGKYLLSSSEINGIRLFLNINGSQLAKILNFNKATISRIINDKQEMQKDAMSLLIEKMGNELETPGITKATLAKIEESATGNLRSLELPPSLIAEWIIRRFDELEECVTNLKLQKLLYYAQGIAVGRYNCKLFEDPFFAWEHGPVLPDIYHKYKSFGRKPVDVNSDTDMTVLLQNQDALRVLEETIKHYGKFSAWILREKTHCEIPWLETEEGAEIEFKRIESFFKSTLV